MKTTASLMPGIILCDGTERDPKTGRISIQRCFDALHFLEFPALAEPMRAVIWLTGVEPQIHEVGLKVVIFDEQSSEIAYEAGGTLKLSPHLPTATRTKRSVFDIEIPITKVRFPRAGIYAIAILVNDVEVGVRPLEIDQL